MLEVKSNKHNTLLKEIIRFKVLNTINMLYLNVPFFINFAGVIVLLMAFVFSGIIL